MARWTATSIVKRTQRVAKRRTLSLEIVNAGAFIVQIVGAAPEAPSRRGATDRPGSRERSQSHGMACQGTWETRFRPCDTAVGGDDRLQTNPGPEWLPAAAPGARERRHEHAGAHGTGRRNNKPKGSGIGGRSAFIVLLKTGNRGHRDPDEGREASHGRATGGKRWRRHRASQTRQRNNSG